MQGTRIHRWIYLHGLLILALLCCVSAPLAADDDTILIVKSSDNTFFNQTIEALINAAGGSRNFIISSVDEWQQNPQTESVAMIISLGEKAARELVQKNPPVAVIHSYLTEYQYHQLMPPESHVTLLLDQPFQRYLQFINAILEVRQVGLVRTESNRIDADLLRSMAESSQLDVEQQLYSADEKPVNVVRNLLRDNDTLLSLPEPQVYNRQTLKGILLASYRQGKPVISYSPSHVRSGALAAIYTSPKDIGEQISGLLRSLQTDNQFSPKPVYFADHFEISVNQKVARSLGIQLPDEAEIKQRMQRVAEQ